MTNIELESAYQQYLSVKQQIDALNKDLNKWKSVIIEAHNGEPTMVTENYQSKLSNCTRMTLLEKAVQEKYHISFDESDYKATNYDRLTVERIKA